MIVRHPELSDKNTVLTLLDEFRCDCIEQITGKAGESQTARYGGSSVYEPLLKKQDCCMFLLENSNSEVVGIITGYLCPMLRNGGVRAEVEGMVMPRN